MMDSATAKGFALLSTLGGTLGGVLASMQATHPSVETVGTGAVGGAAVTAVAWGIMQNTVASHTKDIENLKSAKADKELMTAHLQPMQESLERLHEAVADVHRVLTNLPRK